MSSILIRRGTYRGVEYRVKFTSDQSSEWGSHTNQFFVETDANFSSYYSDSYEKALADIEQQIDTWLNNVPETVQGWVDMIDSCIVQDGYEDWHVHVDSAMQVLEKFAKWRNRNG